MSRPVRYWICATPRSGSSALCAMVAGTGIAGMTPDPTYGAEYLLELVDPSAAERDWKSFDLARYLEGAFERSATPNGVAGFKVFWGQLPRLTRRIGRASPNLAMAADEVAAHLPAGMRYVWLFRRDVVAQAVSLAKAMQTQCWDSESESRTRRLTIFDPLGIHRGIQMIELHNRRWRQFFDHLRIAPLALAYEDFAADPAVTVRRVLEHLGLEGEPVLGDDGPLRPQRDDRNRDWQRRFESLRGAGFRPRTIGALPYYPSRGLANVLTTLRARARTRRIVARRASVDAVPERGGSPREAADPLGQR